MVGSASFKGRDIISMREFDREEIDYVLDTATDMSLTGLWVSFPKSR